MQQTFAYIPTGHRLKITQLARHEYFGQDFKAGKNTVAIFRVPSGGLRAVWSYGNWTGYGLKVGDWAYFQHTQTRRKIEAVLVSIITSADYKVEGDLDTDPAVVQWTLK